MKMYMCTEMHTQTTSECLHIHIPGTQRHILLERTTHALWTPSDKWVVGQVYDSEKDLTEDVVAIDGIVYSLQVLARCIAPCRSPSYLPRGYAVR